MCITKTISITVLSVIAVLNVFAGSYPMPAPGSVWGFANPDIGGARGYKKEYSFSDTILNNGRKYTKWGNSELFTRYDSNLVYEYNDYLKEEILLYDFNLVKGDTFNVRGYTFTVTAADTITMKNGQRRKYIDLEKKDLSQTHKYHWVEGIGDLFGGFFYYPPYRQVETYGLICYCDTSGLVYQKWANVTCENVDSIGTGEPEIDEALTTVFVDESNTLVVNSEKNVSKIELFDVSGFLINRANTNNLSLDSLIAGLYIARITLADGTVLTRKVVIN